MNKLMRAFFTLYAAFVFLFLMFLAYWHYLFIILLYGKKRDKQFLNSLYRFYGVIVARLSFLKIEKKFHFAYDSMESYVVLSNHQSAMDIPANVASAPKDILFKFLGKKEADRIPFFGFLINRLCILVDRKDEQSRKTSYARMKAEMEKGYSIILYPEGTRNRSAEPVKEFYDGGFKLAIEMQKPIVVTTICGIKELNPPEYVLSYRPGKIVCHWEEPISTLGMSLEDLPRLKEIVSNKMITRLKESA